MWLSQDELRELTGKARSSTQQVALNQMGVPYRVRPDGAVLVLRSAVEPTEQARRDTEPRFDHVT